MTRLLTLALIAAFAATAHADVIELKSGQRVEGTLKQVTPASVSVEVGGQTITFTREKVRAIYFGATPTPATKLATEATLSPEFKEKAQRALDAIQRAPIALSRREMTSVNQNLLIEAGKAVDEAKYKAKTTLDGTVLRALQMAVISLKEQGAYGASDPQWGPAADRTSQCLSGVTWRITPEVLSEIGVAQAKQETCNKETDKWGKGITK